MKNIQSLAEILRQHGGDEDTVLAHINPLEAEWLEKMGGSGKTNPVTGLPQYGWGTTLGAIAGSFVGQPTIGAAAGTAIEGSRKKRKKNNGVEYEYTDNQSEDEPSFLSKLAGRSSDFFSDPSNLLAVGSAAASAFSRPKKQRELSPEEKGDNYLRQMMASKLSPEDLAALKKRAVRAERMTPEELREHMAYKQAEERAEWEARNNLAPGERLDFDPLFRKENDDEEFKKKGRRFEYYNDPDFRGKQIYMAQGGEVKPQNKGFMEISIESNPHKTIPSLFDMLKHFTNDNEMSGYIDGEDGGQDDTIEARLSPGEYVIDAETVAHLGDGNSKNGAKKLDEFIKRIREHKRTDDIDDIAPSIMNYRN